MVRGRITRGRHTDNPGGCHSIQTNQQSTSINPHFTPDGLPAATLSIYPGLRQAQEYAGLVSNGITYMYENEHAEYLEGFTQQSITTPHN